MITRTITKAIGKIKLRDHENDHEGHREDQHHPWRRPERADVIEAGVIEAGEDDQTQYERADGDSEDAAPVPVEGP